MKSKEWQSLESIEDKAEALEYKRKDRENAHSWWETKEIFIHKIIFHANFP